MAIFHSHIFDNASGSVGNVTMCKYKGKSIAKGKIFFKKKKPIPGTSHPTNPFQGSFRPVLPFLRGYTSRIPPSILVHRPNPIHRDESKCRGN